MDYSGLMCRCVKMKACNLGAAERGHDTEMATGRFAHYDLHKAIFAGITEHYAPSCSFPASLLI